MVYGGPSCLLLLTPTAVVLFDIQQKKELANLAVAGIKYVTWYEWFYAASVFPTNQSYHTGQTTDSMRRFWQSITFGSLPKSLNKSARFMVSKTFGAIQHNWAWLLTWIPSIETIRIKSAAFDDAGVLLYSMYSLDKKNKANA
jgi:hypothetical protein